MSFLLFFLVLFFRWMVDSAYFSWVWTGWIYCLLLHSSRYPAYCSFCVVLVLVLLQFPLLQLLLLLEFCGFSVSVDVVFLARFLLTFFSFMLLSGGFSAAAVCPSLWHASDCFPYGWSLLTFSAVCCCSCVILASDFLVLLLLGCLLCRFGCMFKCSIMCLYCRFCCSVIQQATFSSFLFLFFTLISSWRVVLTHDLIYQGLGLICSVL